MSTQWLVAFDIQEIPTMPNLKDAKRTMEKLWFDDKSTLLHTDCMTISARVRTAPDEFADAAHGEQLIRQVSKKLQQAYEALTTKFKEMMTSCKVLFDYHRPVARGKPIQVLAYEPVKRKLRAGDAKPQKKLEGKCQFPDLSKKCTNMGK